MYMRYYPKLDKSVQRMRVPPSDRGKRHYWGHELSDYGLFETEDQRLIRRARSNLKDEYSNRIGMSQLDSHFPLQKSYSSNKKIKQEEIFLEAPTHKTLTISKTNEIHLPAIRKITTETQTTNLDISNPEINSRKMKEHKDKEIINMESYCSEHRKHKTEVEEYPYHELSSSKVKYSPTFVCSLENPLPSYLVPHQIYRSRTYVKNE